MLLGCRLAVEAETRTRGKMKQTWIEVVKTDMLISNLRWGLSSNRNEFLENILVTHGEGSAFVFLSFFFIFL